LRAIVVLGEESWRENLIWMGALAAGAQFMRAIFRVNVYSQMSHY